MDIRTSRTPPLAVPESCCTLSASIVIRRSFRLRSEPAFRCCTSEREVEAAGPGPLGGGGAGGYRGGRAGRRVADGCLFFRYTVGERRAASSGDPAGDPAGPV